MTEAVISLPGSPVRSLGQLLAHKEKTPRQDKNHQDSFIKPADPVDCLPDRMDVIRLVPLRSISGPHEGSGLICAPILPIAVSVPAISGPQGHALGRFSYTFAEETFDSQGLARFLEKLRGPCRDAGESFSYRDAEGTKRKGDIEALMADLHKGNVSFRKRALFFNDCIVGSSAPGSPDSYLEIRRADGDRYAVSFFVNGKKDDVEKIKAGCAGAMGSEKWKEVTFSPGEFLLSMIPGGQALIEKKYSGRISPAVKIAELSRIGRIASLLISTPLGLFDANLLPFQPVCLGAPPVVSALAGITQTYRRMVQVNGEPVIPECLRLPAKAVRYLLHPVTAILGDKEIMASVECALSVHTMAQNFDLYKKTPVIDILTHFLSGNATALAGDKALCTFVKDGAKVTGIDQSETYRDIESYMGKHRKGFDIGRKLLLFSLFGGLWEVFEVATKIELTFRLNAARDFVSGVSGTVAGQLLFNTKRNSKVTKNSVSLS
jgi:hypothetical protein